MVKHQLMVKKLKKGVQRENIKQYNTFTFLAIIRVSKDQIRGKNTP